MGRIVVVARQYKLICRASATKDGELIKLFAEKTMDSLIQRVIKTFYSVNSDKNRHFEIHII